MKRTWIYLDNPILNATDNSFRMAVRASTKHDSALFAGRADPVINAMYEIYHEIHLVLVAAYEKFIAQGGLQQGESLNLKQLLRLLSGIKAGNWSSSIRLKYEPTTPRYKALLPNNSTPFQHGTQTQRISAVMALSEAIGTDANLATVKTDVEAFYTLLNTANTTQKGSVSTTKTFSDDVEEARVAMCIAQYANLGGLIQMFAGNPTAAEPFFDLTVLRHGQQVLFTGSVKKQSVHTIVKHTFDSDDKLMLENHGVTPLTFYLSATKNGQPGDITVTVNPGEHILKYASELGSLSNVYLMVSNADAINKGEFVVEMV